MALSHDLFDEWLCAYGDAWCARDRAAFADLFCEDALYYWTPFAPPNKGPSAIGAVFEEAVSRQEEINFEARILYTEAATGAAHWRCAFTRKGAGHRVSIDGVLMTQMNDAGKAVLFREWWHSNEEWATGSKHDCE